MGFCVCFLFCFYTIHCVLYGKHLVGEERAVVFLMSCDCFLFAFLNGVMVGLQCVIVEFSDHNHFLFSELFSFYFVFLKLAFTFLEDIMFFFSLCS